MRLLRSPTMYLYMVERRVDLLVVSLVASLPSLSSRISTSSQAVVPGSRRLGGLRFKGWREAIFQVRPEESQEACRAEEQGGLGEAEIGDALRGRLGSWGQEMCCTLDAALCKGCVVCHTVTIPKHGEKKWERSSRAWWEVWKVQQMHTGTV